MYSTLPRQKLPISQKNETWQKDTMDYYIRMSYTTNTGNRTSNYNKLTNYDLFNGKFNKADLEYVCNPLGLAENEFPATLQHYDVCSKPIELLISEESARPDNQMVISESPTDLNRKQGALKEKITGLLQQHLMGAIDPSTIDPNNPPQTPEEILKYEKYTPSDLIESKANKILKYLKRKLVTKEVFKKGWKDSLIAGEEMYWTGVQNGEPMLRRCNPVNMTVVLDSDSDFVDEAIAVVETRLLSPSSIIDEYGEELTVDQVSQLETITRQVASGNQNSGSNSPTFTLTNTGVIDTNLAPHQGVTTSGYGQFLVRVSRVEWKSLKKMYYVTYTDENEQLVEEILDEVFKPSIAKQVYPDLKAEEFWITEAWEGVKIGMDMYIGCKPKTNQRRRIDNPYVCKLGYTGYIYNATNSQSVSLLDRIKPYQYLYNVLMYRLELAFASDQGKVMLMDLAQIPRSEGIDIEKWMYYLKAMKIGFINSFEEGKKGQSTGKLSTFNQFQSIDLSLSNTIQQYISSLEYIHQQVYFISGVSPQRLGAVNQNELVGNVEKAVQQSSMITEHYFELHDEIKRRTYTALIEVAKIAFRDGKIAQYILDDMGIEMLNIEEFELESSEFGVFMSNTKKDVVVHETLKQLAQIALQSEKADLSTIIDTIVNDSSRDIIRTLQKKEQEFYQRKGEEGKQAQEMQSEQLQHQAKLEQDKLDLERERMNVDRYISDSSNETKIQVSEIQVYSRQQDLDQNNNGVPDPVELGKLSLQERELASNSFMEQDNLRHERDKHKRELDFKDRELKAKQEIENKKLETVKTQNRSQEDMANKKHKADKELADKKIMLEKMKIRAAKNKPKTK